MSLSVILISAKKEDAQWAERLCAFGSRSLVHFSSLGGQGGANYEKIREMISQESDVLIFQDVAELDLSGLRLLKLMPNDVCVIDKTAASEHRELVQSGEVCHYLRRGSDLKSIQIVQWIVDRTSPFELSRSQSFDLAHSVDSSTVLLEVESLLGTLGLPPRLSQMILQGADELLMNALFNAPLSKKGVRYRVLEERGAKFELKPAEKVTVQIATSKEFGVIQVIDSFGSFDRRSLIPEKRSLDKAGAGEGIYLILKSGLSLHYSVKPGEQTVATLLFPIVESMTAFREVFQIFSFVSG